MNIRSFARFSLTIILLLTFASAEEKEKQIPFDLLAVHKAEAVFTGTREQKCMGRTSLCPNQCGHSGTLAQFAIDKYTEYRKPGEYGDPKQKTFQFLIEDNMKNPKVTAELLAKVNTLKPGDKVVLEWEHRYMNRNGSRYPERPVTRLEKMP